MLLIALNKGVDKMLKQNGSLLLLSMENLDGGYAALVVVGLVFLGLQIWWISLIIKNGMDQSVLTNQNQTEEIKKRLEKIFSK